MARSLYRYMSILLLGLLAVKLRKNVATSLRACREGMYGQITSDKKIACKHCSKLPLCPPATGLSVLVLCSGEILPRGTDIHCVKCVLGKNFSSLYDHSQCQPCRSLRCHPNEAFTGKCTLEEDSTQCSGTCKSGFYSVDGKLDHCMPCSQCQNSISKRVQKCKKDGMPEDKQCPFTKRKDAVREPGKQFYEFYGHPAMFGALLVIIAGLVVCLLVILFKMKKHKKKNNRSQTQPEAEPLTAATTTQDERSVVNVSDMHDETDTYDDKVELPSVLRKRSSSASSGRPRKVSFTRQHSNPEANEERTVQASSSSSSPSPNGTSVNGMKTSANLQIPETRIRSQSSGSAKRFPVFKRQNSNPLPKHKEQSFRKSKTFSNFTSILPGQKGLSEETTPMLTNDENSNVLTMKNPAQDNHPGPTMETLTNVKVDELNAELHLKICRKLNSKIDGKDWQTLAGKMSYSNENVMYFKSTNNPAAELLSHWGTKSGNDMAKLVDLLKQMERGDIVELVEEEIVI